MAATVVEAHGSVLVVPGRPRYHAPACRHVGRADEVDLHDARAAGLTPCSACRPDEALLRACTAEAAAAMRARYAELALLPDADDDWSGHLAAWDDAPAAPRPGVLALAAALLVLLGVVAAVALQPEPARPAAAPAVVEQAPALALGQAAVVGDFVVTVTAVDAAAGARLAAADPANPPAVHGYVLVDAVATYVGATTGTPALDLAATLTGGDGRRYDDAATPAVSPLAALRPVGLVPGGSGAVDFVVDVPAGALDGARFTVSARAAGGAGPSWALAPTP